MIRTVSLLAAVTLTAAGRAEDPAKPAPYSDAAFVTMAAACGEAEMQAGSLAVTNAKSEAVRKFGQMMVDEHKKANEKLMEVAQKAGLAVTAKPTAEHQKCLDKLKDLKGAEFDKEYMTEQVKGHEIAVREFKRAKAEATDSGVKDFASKSLSTLEKHLDIAKKILADGK